MSLDTIDTLASRRRRWAQFRFSVIGPMLSSPPARGELAPALTELAKKLWRHPIHGQTYQVSRPTLERWYYQARSAPFDPVSVLERTTRKDARRFRGISVRSAELLREQHQTHPSWSYKLHADNLAVVLEAERERVPSYPTVRRYMKAHGLLKTRRLRCRPGEREPDRPAIERREVRSFEVEHANALWHLDFHHASRAVLTRSGTWTKPIALAIVDDYSRLCCHAQWYWAETAQCLAHGLSQAIQKRGLPRSLLTDNGAAMVAAEVREGLLRLGIVHETTLPYSPHQNGKQEVFWGRLEGRCLAMLDGVAELTLDGLNHATQAWVEREYNRDVHSETKEAPAERFLTGPDVGRASPSGEDLRLAFRQDVRRTQRRSDGTITLEGVRFELPSRYRFLERVTIRYASWDKRVVHLIDERTGLLLCPLYPIDKQKNASQKRRSLEPPAVGGAESSGPGTAGVAPLLQRLISEYDSSGLAPAYLAGPEPIEATPSICVETEEEKE